MDISGFFQTKEFEKIEDKFKKDIIKEFIDKIKQEIYIGPKKIESEIIKKKEKIIDTYISKKHIEKVLKHYSS